MKTLNLTLKKQWFDMTKSGIKTEDYREITPYWCNRFLLYEGENRRVIWWGCMENFEGCFFREAIESSVEIGIMKFKKCKTNIMTLGYPKKGDKERILELEHKGIEVGTGNPEWGAEPNKIYFVVKHGKTINTDLQEAIKKAKPNMDKIEDVDKHLDEIRNGGIKII